MGLDNAANIAIKVPALKNEQNEDTSLDLRTDPPVRKMVYEDCAFGIEGGCRSAACEHVVFSDFPVTFTRKCMIDDSVVKAC